MFRDAHNILILAHPGHELRIHHWLEMNKPTVYLLTDGSGGQMASRVHFSKDLIDRCGARSGAVFGEISDKDWYASIMAGKNDLLVKTIQTIIDDAPKNYPIQIVADALDGYNPMHDMAWFIGKIVHHQIKQKATAFPFLASAATTNVQGSVELSIQLNTEARARKISAVESYMPLAEEARRILEQDPLAFDEEKLISQSFDWQAKYDPLWEKIGRQRVNDGIYSDCLTFQQHVKPLVKDLITDE